MTDVVGGHTSKRLYTTGEVARILGVSQATVWVWCKEGKIRARKTPGGQYRIPVDEVERLERELYG